MTIVHATVGSRAAAAIDPTSPVVVAAATERAAEDIARRLEAVGFGDLRGILGGGMQAWRAAGLEVASTESIGAGELAARLRRGGVALLDVRDENEWESGHVPGSLHVPLLVLRASLAELHGRLDATPVAVACSAGNRAAVAVSMLERDGFEHVIHLADSGVEDLARHGIELTEPLVEAAN